MAANDPERLARAIAAIDAANADDPNRIVWRGESRPKELVHAELMTAWVHRLAPEPSDAQLLAARAHHLRRWESPRAAYPPGRAGYLRWRAAAKKRHAELVAALLAAEGFEPALIDEVGRIIRKEGLGSDPVVQVHEDALCLTFLETQVDEVTDRLGEDKMLEVLVKTLPKMSATACGLAAGLPLGPRARTLLSRAASEVRGS